MMSNEEIEKWLQYSRIKLINAKKEEIGDIKPEATKTWTIIIETLEKVLEID